MAAIKVKNLSVEFKETKALNNVNVQFEENQIHGLIGRNGSGKTVLMKSICGFLPIQKGEIEVFGEKLINGRIPRDIGIMIENPGFLPAYSGLMNLAFLAGIKRKVPIAEIKDQIRRVGLDPDSKKHVSKYSLGMRQRLAIAQALMENPSLLLLDEPMNGLDNRGVEEVRKLLLELKKEGKTMIITSHNPLDIIKLCDTIHEMDEGVISSVDVEKYRQMF